MKCSATFSIMTCQPQSSQGGTAGVALRAVERAAVEELLEAFALGGRRGVHGQRERDRASCTSRTGRVLCSAITGS